MRELPPKVERALGRTIGRRSREQPAEIDPGVYLELRRMVFESGITGDDRQAELVMMMRWHLGLLPPHQKPMIRSGLSAVDQYTAELIARRAWELVDENRRRLPAVEHEIDA